MHFSLVKISPDDSPAHGFDDAMLPLFFALRSLGYEVEILYNRSNPASRNIVFGSCFAPRRVGRGLPPGSIIFNLEQIVEGSKWANRDYLAHLRDFTVWDYSPGNIKALERAGIAGAGLVPPGYVPEMTRIRRDSVQDVDVLFYGLINDRRHAAIKSLCDAGLKVLATQEAFGNLRDALLARSRLLLNVHYYLPAKLEIVRLGYAFANGKAVVAEWRDDTEIPAGLEGACAFFPYEELVNGARQLLADADLRKKQEREAFAAFAAMPLAKNLERVVGRRVFSAGRGTAAVKEAGVEKDESGGAGSAGGTEENSGAPGRTEPGSGVILPEWLIVGDIR